MNGRTWKNIDLVKSDIVKNLLIKCNAEKVNITNEYEGWRYKIYDSTIIYYKKGTIYSTPSNTAKDTLQSVWNKISEAITGKNINSNSILIGIDETGKGEIYGSIYIAAALIPASISNKLSNFLSTADTKKKQPVEYWNLLYKKIISFKNNGLRYIAAKIKPSSIDSYKINELQDLALCQIIDKIFEMKNNDISIIIDDYGVGNIVKEKLVQYNISDIKSSIIQKSEDKHIEVKTASIIAKYYREQESNGIKHLSLSLLDGRDIGTGNLQDPETISWLKKHYTINNNFPNFIRKSFKTIREIENLPPITKKPSPPADIQFNMKSL